MLPSEGGKHIFKDLVSCRMEIQQHLKAVWKNLENIMTIDEEMKDLLAKGAKASRKQENCKNNVRFAIVFCAARRHSEAHSIRKAKFLLNMIVHRFARMCFLLERGVYLDR